MTQEQLKFIIETGKEFDFTVKRKKYLIYYSKTPEGKHLIHLSEDFIPIGTYESFTHLMTEAKIQNSFFKEVLNDL